jgi:lactoylglutathione lyase
MPHRVTQAIPFFRVTDIYASLRFYVEGLGFAMTRQWSPEGRIRWCWLELDKVALMLQERKRGQGGDVLGDGVSICLACDDALAMYREFVSREVPASRPIVGNGLWVTLVSDPDGYRLAFESPTDEPEDTVYAG